MRNGTITMINFINGDGTYKMELSNLNNANIEEIESLVNKWHKEEDDKMLACIKMILTDVTEGRFNAYETSLKDCLEWLDEKIKSEPENVDQINSPSSFGKYVDDCLGDAADHYYSKGSDTYTLADVFYAGMRCQKEIERTFQKCSEEKSEK